MNEELVHMILVDINKKGTETSYTPIFASTSLLEAKETFSKSKKGLAKISKITLDTPNYFIAEQDEWITKYKLFSMPMHRIIRNSGYEE